MNENVVTQLLQKGDSEAHIVDSIYNLGPEADFLGVIRGSNNNNFEEDYILGLNKITTLQDENGIEYETIEFRSKNIDNNYYQIEKKKYQTVEINSNISLFYNTTKKCYQLQLNANPGSMEYDATEHTLTQDLNKDNNFYFDVVGGVIISPIANIEEQTLKYHASNFNDIDISQKVIIDYSEGSKNLRYEMINNVL